MALNLSLWQLTLAVVLQAKKKKAAAPSTTLTLVRHLGGIALLPLAVLDSTIIPTFGSLDLLTAWLAVGDPERWWYYALMSTVGSLIGALIMGVLQNGLNLLAVRPFYQQIAIGAVLILAVWLDRINSREGWKR